MLVFTRAPATDVVIGNDIRIHVLSVEGGKVRIGVDAPDALEVDRGEIRDRKIQEGRRRFDRRRQSLDA